MTSDRRDIAYRIWWRLLCKYNQNYLVFYDSVHHNISDNVFKKGER